MGSEPIKICFIAPKTYSLFNPAVQAHFGGANVDLYYLSTELAKDPNFDVSFIVADYGQPDEERRENVRLLKSLDFNAGQLAGAVRVWRAIKTADAQIYFQKAASLGTFLIALFCKLHKRIFIYRTASQRECNGEYFKKHFFAGKSFCWSLHNAKRVIVQNEIDKANLRQTADVRSEVIGNAHHLPVVSGSDKNVILWVGRSAAVKRPELFIDLAEEISGESFVMVCQHATDDEKYEELVTRAKAVENLEFIEWVGFDKIDSYFQRAKVFINTSESEGFPNAFIQACKYATPILSLNVNPDDFLNKHHCGMCANDDWDVFVDMLKQLLNNDKIDELGNNARRYAEENHNIAEVIKQYKAVFEQVVNRNCAQTND
ncbi:MAG: glycosyltransferase family 4 protein [Planctomycetota bacterium]|jgi:glycosyltransferase involved in cell wall biosynthesis